MKRAVALLTIASFFAMGAGFLREITVAYYFGTSGDADAFALVMFYVDGLTAVVLVGVASYLMVPVMAKVVQDRGKEEAFRLLETCLLWVSVVGLPLLALGIWRVDDLAVAIAPDLDAARRATLVRLLYFALPTIYLILISGAISGILQARRDYYMPVHGRTLFALTFVAVLPLAANRLGIMAVGIGLLAGGVLQASVQLHALRRLGWRARWGRPHHPALVGAIRAGVPILLALVLTNVVMGGAQRALASSLPVGAFASVNYAQRSLNIVSGLTLALATVSMTELAVQYSAEGVTAGTLAALRETLESGLLMLIPLSALLYIVAEPVIALLFHRGRYDVASVQLTAACLRWFALSVAPGMVLAVLHRAAPTFGRPWRSTATSLLWTLSTIAATVLLLPQLGAEALAAGFAAGTILAALGSVFVLRDLVPLRFYAPILGYAGRTVIIAAAGLGATVAVLHVLGTPATYAPAESIARLAALVGAFAPATILAGVLLRDARTHALLANAAKLVRWAPEEGRS
jgi:putative peptidoglycan lipid II flippase